MPTTSTPDEAWVTAVSRRTACSARQGTHHGAQKLTNTIDPSTSVSENAAEPSIGVITALGTLVSIRGEGESVGSLPNREAHTTANTATTRPAPLKITQRLIMARAAPGRSSSGARRRSRGGPPPGRPPAGGRGGG